MTKRVETKKCTKLKKTRETHHNSLNTNQLKQLSLIPLQKTDNLKHRVPYDIFVLYTKIYVPVYYRVVEWYRLHTK